MDKLSIMFDAKQFATAFGASRDDSSAAPNQLDATVWLQGNVAAGTGFTWGCGQMNCQGRNHLFRVSSLSIAEAGAASIYATGRVMRLRKVSDLSGNYRLSSAGGTMAEVGAATYLQNEHGVVIQLVARDASTAASRSVNGVRVRLKHV